MLRLLCGLSVLSCAAGLAFAQPANNNCSAATVISPGAPSATGTNVAATTDGPGTCVTMTGDIWYRWTAPAGASIPMAADTCGSSFDTVLTIYQATSCPVTTGQAIGCSDDDAQCGSTPFRQSRVAFTATGGATYFFRVGGFNGATGNVTLNFGPANDSCAAPVPVNSGTFTGSNVGAQTNGNLVCGSIGADLWYRWTAPSNVGTTTINTCGSDFDTVLAVYNAGACPVTDTQNIACSDDDGACGTRLSQVTFTPVAGQSYLIRIGGFEGATGNFQVNIQNSACFASQPTIQGNLLACGNQSTTLSIPFNVLADAYDWRVDGAPYASVRSVAFGPFPPGSRRVECIITINGCGSYTTPPVTLVSTVGPQITATTGGGLFCGSSGFLRTLGVTATGPNLTYQWFSGANPLNGETSSTLDIAFSSTVSYFCRVTNQCGSVDSPEIVVTVSPFVEVQSLPASQTLCAGSTLTLTASATNATSLQWQRNGVDIQGANSATLTRPNMTPALGGTYRCVVTNPCGSVNSSDCIVTVQSPISITGTMPNITSCEGQMVTFNVPFSGTAPTCVWRRNGQIIQGQTSTSLSVTATAATAGEYQCTLTNSCGSVGANAFLFTVRPATAITQQPPSSSLFCYASNGSISVTAQGHQLTFQWLRNGQPLADGPLPGGTMVTGSQSSTLAFSNIQFDGLGEYQCIVSGTCGPTTVNSNVVAVTLGGPVITVGPGQTFTAIQPAVNSLSNCGKILVLPGTYNERVNIGGKRVWLESTGGPAVTIINGGNSSDPVASVITSIFTSLDDAAQVIKGFTITGGRGLASSTTRLGGGIVFALPNGASTSPLIENCIIEGNFATSGGGVYVQGQTTLLLRNTIIRNNQTVGSGSLQSLGGAMDVVQSSVNLDRCTVANNSSTGGPNNGQGGGIVVESSTPSRFTNCLIKGNSAGNCGGILTLSAPVSIINCTMTNATSQLAGSVVRAENSAQVTVANSVIFGNAGSPFASGAGSSLTINRSNVQPGATGFTGSNNISTNPLFISATDFRLGAGSPCIDAGDNTLVPAGLPLDLAGLPRYADDPSAPDTGSTGNGGGASIVDMGAFERSTVPADTCADAPTLLAGTYAFSTVEAATDGPDEGTSMPCAADPRYIADVWFRYRAECSAEVSISLCDSNFDTQLAVYRGGTCPTSPGLIAGCNDDSACGVQSQLTLPVTAGELLLVRIGGFDGATGTGNVTISCTVACPADFNGDGSLDPDDLADFIGAFFSQPAGLGSDFNNDGLTDPDDLADFIGAFFGGCM